MDYRTSTIREPGMINNIALGNHLPTPITHGDSMLGNNKNEELLPYYVVNGNKCLTCESISILAWHKSIRIELMSYVFDDLAEKKYLLAECKAVDPQGNSAIGAAVEKQGMHALASGFSRAQKQAMEQLIPQSEIKQALGIETDGYEPPKLINHYSAAYAAKKSLDRSAKVNHKSFWLWLDSQTKGKVKNWTDLKQDTKLCCRLAALLNHLRTYQSTAIFF